MLRKTCLGAAALFAACCLFFTVPVFGQIKAPPTQSHKPVNYDTNPCDPDIGACNCYDFDGWAYCPSYVALEPSVEASITLYYRPVNLPWFVPFIAQHTFWYLRVNNYLAGQYIGGVSDVLDAGPSNPSGCPNSCGYLDSWTQVGTIGHLTADNIGTATNAGQGRGLSESTYGYYYDMLAFQREWPENYAPYLWASFNSNTWAHAAAIANGLNPWPNGPPVIVPGW
jgi:hypothetical protein